MTACGLLRVLLLRKPYLTTLRPKMQLSNISVKYSEENSVSGGGLQDRGISDRRRQSSLLARILLLFSLTHKDSIAAYD